MKRGESIHIERVGNGFFVHTEGFLSSERLTNVLVFQKLERERYDDALGQTLIEWLREHFAEPDVDPSDD